MKRAGAAPWVRMIRSGLEPQGFAFILQSSNSQDCVGQDFYVSGINLNKDVL